VLFPSGFDPFVPIFLILLVRNSFDLVLELFLFFTRCFSGLYSQKSTCCTGTCAHEVFESTFQEDLWPQVFFS